ncbi:hypothetical protein M8C21_015174 [Ambrosia artemisiifolia]|uniref:Dof-type domain-containing protein n=1 Tax=Ambrosia artemisiifolia TaxID=4212 RepID=A0AAD5G2E9_AMBAR|nr:hypothetical protein M8C21_015174 [Ambrosia artemisiifolia]
MEDPGIKLFGKKIVLPGISKSTSLPVISSTAAEEPEPTGSGGTKESGSDNTVGHTCSEDDEKVDRAAAEKDEQKANCSETKSESDNPKTPSIDEETKNESTNPQKKTLKKPDKILPCPRCTSMDTKFCYFNNYNVNQPRHFCKSCQRYWTAGGAMRTMAVGAGRRKNKNSASHPRYITISQESVTISDPAPENIQDKNAFHSKVHSIPGTAASWPYVPVPIPIPIPAICPPMPIYPSTYWNCIPFIPPSTPRITDSILGKRSRDESVMQSNECDDESKKQNNSVLIPKTLRIDDPDEAAKSSIWATLGIRNENFKAFQEKSIEKKKHHETTASPAHQANPAAFSRSICFQETA